MRVRQVFDDWMRYDEKLDALVIREDAPDDIKRAYDEFNKDNEERIKNGERIMK